MYQKPLVLALLSIFFFTGSKTLADDEKSRQVCLKHLVAEGKTLAAFRPEAVIAQRYHIYDLETGDNELFPEHTLKKDVRWKGDLRIDNKRKDLNKPYSIHEENGLFKMKLRFSKGEETPRQGQDSYYECVYDLVDSDNTALEGVTAHYYIYFNRDFN